MEPEQAAPLGSEENPMTEDQAVEAGVDVETVKEEAEPVVENSVQSHNDYDPA